MKEPSQPVVVIAGVGLIGGSIGLCLRERGMARRVIGLGRSLERLQVAKDLGAIDELTLDWSSAMSEADIVVLCGPISTIAHQAMEAWGDRRSDEILITDAGSTKVEILSKLDVEPNLAARFVGAHPIAGSERSGAGASRADLFSGRTCVLTPTLATSPEAIQKARWFWEGLGCRLVEMGPEEHDKALAQTSHLPHVLAAALALCVDPENHSLSAGAFRDMTRIAASDGGLWRDIFLSNRKSLENALDNTVKELLRFRGMLANESSVDVEDWWREARRRRLAYEELVIERNMSAAKTNCDSQK
jgi:prephenate dehydrogenase